MRVLLSTIGSRGDVQPLVALALQLRALGQDVRLCVPPDFREWIDSFGFPVTPIGPELRKAAASSSQGTPKPLTPEQRRQLEEFRTSSPPAIRSLFHHHTTRLRCCRRYPGRHRHL